MAESSDESAHGNSSSHTSYHTAINGNVVGTEVVGTMSKVELRLEVSIVPVPSAVAEIAPASVEIANTAFPSRQESTMVETRPASEDHMPCVMMHRNGSDSVMRAMNHVNPAIVVMDWGSIADLHLAVSAAACIASATSLSVCVNTCHYHGDHDHCGEKNIALHSCKY